MTLLAQSRQTQACKWTYKQTGRRAGKWADQPTGQQAGRQTKLLLFINFLQYDNLNSTTHLGYLNRYTVKNNFLPIDLCPVIKGNVIVRLFIQTGNFGKPQISLSISTIKYM